MQDEQEDGEGLQEQYTADIDDLRNQLRQVNQDQANIDSTIEKLTNEIDIYNEGYYIKNQFIRNGQELAQIVESIAPINLDRTEAEPEGTLISKKYWFLNCQH